MLCACFGLFPCGGGAFELWMLLTDEARARFPKLVLGIGRAVVSCAAHYRDLTKLELAVRREDLRALRYAEALGFHVEQSTNEAFVNFAKDIQMSGAVRSVSKAVGLSPKIPDPYNPATDPVYQEQLAASNRARDEATKAQTALRADQEAAKARAIAEQRDLASQESARKKARRFGGARALLSEERLNPELGLTSPSSLG
jgi:hypothetical protein